MSFAQCELKLPKPKIKKIGGLWFVEYGAPFDMIHYRTLLFRWRCAEMHCEKLNRRISL